MVITTSFIPRPYSGMTLWPFVLIRPDADKTILPHEMMHYRRQAWWSPVWWLLYLVSPAFRLREEVLAYRESVANGMSVSEAAMWLTTYRTGVQLDEALNLIEKTTPETL